MKNAWHSLWSVSVFDNPENDDDFQGLKTQAAELLQYARDMNHEVTKNLCEDEIIDWMHCSGEASLIYQVMDDEIVTMIKNPTEDIDEDSDSDSEELHEKINMNQGIKL